MLTHLIFSYNDTHNLIYIQIFISDHIFNMIGLNHREVATLHVKRWPYYVLLGITI